MAKGEVVECGTHKELVAAGTISPQIYKFFPGFKYFPNIFLYLLIFTSTMFWQVECTRTCGVSKPEERRSILNSEEGEGEEEDEEVEVKVVVGALVEEVSKTGWGGGGEGEEGEEEGVVVEVTGIEGFK